MSSTTVATNIHKLFVGSSSDLPVLRPDIGKCKRGCKKRSKHQFCTFLLLFCLYENGRLLCQRTNKRQHDLLSGGVFWQSWMFLGRKVSRTSLKPFLDIFISACVSSHPSWSKFEILRSPHFLTNNIHEICLRKYSPSSLSSTYIYYICTDLFPFQVLWVKCILQIKTTSSPRDSRGHLHYYLKGLYEHHREIYH